MSNTNDIYNVQPNQSNQSNQHGQNTPPPIYIQLPPQRTWGCGSMFLQFIVSVGVFFVCCFLTVAFLAAIGTVMSESLEEISQQEKQLNEKFIQGNSKSKDKIAILTISGIINMEEDGFVAKQVRQITKDQNVKAVILRVDSPGGSVSGSDYYLHLLKKMKAERNNIPIVVSMGSLAASGGYYVSMVGDEIYAEPSTTTGSIGVIVPLFNASSLCEKIGFESTPITSGRLKGMGSITKQMTEEERKVWQKLVDDSFAQFKSVIREGRKNFDEDPDLLDKLATGQVYNATEAKTNGLIDNIGYIDDAIDKAISLSGVSEHDVKVVKYKPKSQFMETLLEGKTATNLMSAETISDLTTPKIYLIMPQVIPVK
ncbi:MAG: signal peptide peptidase SppA [Planctomycetaceae bacterium]|jgi:protease-4|nr:signal peptide peptidase SppA [Planctomycetaceae bacterium]